MSQHSKEKVYTKRPLCVVYYGVDFSFDGRQGGLNFDSCSFACTVRENQVWKATIESCRFWEEDDYGYEIVSVLIIVLLREPTSLWRENVIAVIILLRVLAREGREGTLRNEEAYELTTFARRRRWTAWQACCACLSGHLPASRQSRRCCWQRFASVLEKAWRGTNFRSFPYIFKRIFPVNSSITLGTCSLHMFSICLSVFIGLTTRRINTIATVSYTHLTLPTSDLV